MRFVGLMSGTSADGIDAALVEIDDGLPRLIKAAGYSHTPELRERIERAVTGETLDTEALGLLDRDLGIAFADATLQLLHEAGCNRDAVTAIGSHGQTILHRPEAGFSVQIGSGSVIAARTSIDTVNDFRAADLAHGGQGAPLAPALHAAVLADTSEHRAVLNLGGIANLTSLPPGGDVAGFDTGPANTLLDQWHARHRGERFDRNGSWSAAGTVDARLLAQLLAEPYFQAPPPKSTGRELFNLPWLDAHLERHGSPVPPEDVQATLAELTSTSVSQAVTRWCPGTRALLVCGGGTHNDDIMRRLRQHLDPHSVRSTSHYGIDPDWVEAIAFGWLAWRYVVGKTGNLPSVTGARNPAVLGALWPASGPG